MDQLLGNLLEKSNRVDEVNIPARLAADDLISSFGEAYQDWEARYKDQLSEDDFGLAKRMIMSVPHRAFMR